LFGDITAIRNIIIIIITFLFLNTPFLAQASCSVTLSSAMMFAPSRNTDRQTFPAPAYNDVFGWPYFSFGGSL